MGRRDFSGNGDERTDEFGNRGETVPFLPELTVDLKQEHSGGIHG
jgi:hypothetical protein